MSRSALGLLGESISQNHMPSVCRCGCKRFYKQTDFNRNLGLVVVGIAALATFILAFQGYSWLITWSPMPIALIFDFSLSKSRPLAVICYKCGLIYRDLAKEEINQVEDFNLEVFDLIKYPERT